MQKFRSHAFGRPIKKTIQIKTENDVRRLKIRLSQPPKKSSTEKKVLIDKITALQTENQRCVQASMELQKLYRKLQQESAEKISSLTSELKAAKLENRSLQARIVQLQSSVIQQQQQHLNRSTSESESGGIYPPYCP